LAGVLITAGALASGITVPIAVRGETNKSTATILGDSSSVCIVIELFRITREGHLSDTSSAVEKVTGKKPNSFVQFAKDYVHDFLG
jgi:hypothetical protein